MGAVHGWFTLLTMVAPALHLVSGHGRLMEPPSRGSMWRQGFPSPINYADNQLFCGGFKHQWEDQNGRCGVCGDPYDGPRDHEPGGKYYTGITTKTFTRGQIIDFKVELTAFHYGYFEFRLCPLEYRNQTVGQECFDKHILKIITPSESGVTTRYKLPSDPSIRMVKLKTLLPGNVTCEQCVLQWKYHAANSWGEEKSGRGCVGCGPQEEFYGCSDVQIIEPGGATTTHNAHRSAIHSDPAPNAGSDQQGKAAQKSSPESMNNRVIKGEEHQDDWGPWSRPTYGRPRSNEWQGFKKQPASVVEPRSLDSLKDMKASLVGNCHATGAWKGQASMDDWCEVNCERGHCPKSHCLCVQQKKAPVGYSPEPLGRPATQQQWSPIPKQTPRKYDQHPQQGSSPTTRFNVWEFPQKQRAADFQIPGSYYIGSRPRARKARFPGEHVTGVGRAHNDVPYWSGEGGDAGPSQRYRRRLKGERKAKNKIRRKENIDDILAYSQETFYSIKDQAEAAYRSLTGKDVPDFPAGFLDEYRNFGEQHPSRNSLFTSPDDLYKADGYGLTGRLGGHARQNTHYTWKPHGRSGPVYKKFHVQEPGNFPKGNHHSYNRRRSNYGDRDLISKAQFVDDKLGVATTRWRPEGKKASLSQSGDRDFRGRHCVAAGAWTGQAPMTKWCQGNCALGNCPATHCKCT